jgi:hypothetical protein
MWNHEQLTSDADGSSAAQALARRRSLPSSVLLLLLLAASALFTSACASVGGGPDGTGGASGMAGSGEAGGMSGATGAAGGAGNSGDAGSAGSGGGPDCGGRVCASAELCVRSSCGGPAPLCQPLADGGQCPTGWTFRELCPQSGVRGCEEPPCTPPAPRCITKPAACPATPTCSCLPHDVCQPGGGACSLISNGEILCASA